MTGQSVRQCSLSAAGRGESDSVREKEGAAEASGENCRENISRGTPTHSHHYKVQVSELRVAGRCRSSLLSVVRCCLRVFVFGCSFLTTRARTERAVYTPWHTIDDVLCSSQLPHTHTHTHKSGPQSGSSYDGVDNSRCIGVVDLFHLARYRSLLAVHRFQFAHLVRSPKRHQILCRCARVALPSLGCDSCVRTIKQ